jgi:hypothetical protein
VPSGAFVSFHFREFVVADPTSIASEFTPVWGAKNIARVINRTERQTYLALEKGELPGAKKIAGRWMFVPAKFFEAVAA